MSNLRMKLTAVEISKLRPAAQRYSVTDTEIPGLELRVTPSGVLTYAVFYRNRAGKKVRFTLGRHGAITPVQTRKAAMKTLAEVRLGSDPQREKRESRRVGTIPTLFEFVDGEYGEWVRTHHRSGPETVVRLRTKFAADFGRVRLDRVTIWNAEKWRARRLKEGISKLTVNRDLAALKACLSKAAQWGVILENPLAALKPVRVDRNSDVRYLTADEERRLREVLATRNAELKASRVRANEWRRRRAYEPLPDRAGRFADHLTPMVLVSLNTGMRRGELFALAWSRVDLTGRQITVAGASAKSGTTRHIPINDEVVDVRTAWRPQQQGRRGLVFPGRNGQPLDNVQNA